MKPLHPQARRAGFSLAELMVVIVIIGLLATMVVPNVLDRMKSSQVKIAKADLVNLDSAIELFVIENNGTYPDSLDQLVQKDESGTSYLKRSTIPKDPWGEEYMYEPPFGGQSYRLYSFGADKTQGGEGDGKDLTIDAIKNQED